MRTEGGIRLDFAGLTRDQAGALSQVKVSGESVTFKLHDKRAALARDVMVEGESGILSVSPDETRPLYEPSKRRLTWPNGAIAMSRNTCST